jgi:hypothetical protein
MKLGIASEEKLHDLFLTRRLKHIMREAAKEKLKTGE